MRKHLWSVSQSISLSLSSIGKVCICIKGFVIIMKLVINNMTISVHQLGNLLHLPHLLTFWSCCDVLRDPRGK